MAEERRSAPRARISGVRVTYESKTGDHVETDALNLGRGGLFVRTAKPVAIGKRIALEIHVAGEIMPWSALGRVVWSRETDDRETRPAGMGVKLIDVEDGATATIDRLVQSHAAPVSPIVPVAPARERTMLGVGTAFATPDPVLPPPELGPEREHSVPIDLISKKEETHPIPPADHAEAWNMEWPTADKAEFASEEPPAIPRPARGRWVFVGVLLAAAAAAAYLVLDGDFDRILRPREPVAAPLIPPVPAPQALTASPASTAPPTSTPTPTTTWTSLPPPPSPSTPRSAPSAATASSPWRPNAPIPPPASAAKKPPAADNPY